MSDLSTPSGAYCRHAFPGAPIEVLFWGDGAVNHSKFVNDIQAVALAQQLLQAVLENQQAALRPVVDGQVRAVGFSELVRGEGLADSAAGASQRVLGAGREGDSGCPPT